MPFNVYLDDKLFVKNVTSPHVLSGLNPATEYKLSVTEVIKDVESPKWNGKLLTKAIVEAETIAFIQHEYEVIEGDSIFVEPLVIPWNTTNRDKMDVQLLENDGVLEVAEDKNSIKALKVGTAKVSPIAEFVSRDAELYNSTIKVLPKGTKRVYPQRFGIGPYVTTGEGSYFTNEIYVSQYDTTFIQFGILGTANMHDWQLEAVTKDIISVGNHGRRVTGLKVGEGKAKIFYKSNPTVVVEVTIHVTDEPSDIIFEKTTFDGKVGDTGEITVKYIPQATIPKYPLHINNRNSNLVKVEANKADPTKLNYEILGVGLAQVRVSCGNSTRIIMFSSMPA